jgi:predicted RNA binding protein YcfA (HicA-like mRNA interferase family)
MKYREAVKKLKKLGCQELPRRGKGSHRIWYNPETDELLHFLIGERKI